MTMDNMAAKVSVYRSGPFNKPIAIGGAVCYAV
jgi:hypothetical protein